MKILLIIILSIASFSFILPNRIDLKTKNQIHNDLLSSQKYFKNLDLLNSLKEANAALILSKKYNYTEGEVKSYIYLSKIYIEIGNYNKSIELLNSAEKELLKGNFDEMNVEVCRLKGLNYSNLKMNNLALKEFNKQILLSKKIKDNYNKNLSTFWAYQNISHVYNTINNDSVWKYLNLQLDYLKRMDYNKNFIDYSNTYNQIGSQYIKENNIDSAFFYLKKAKTILDEKHSPYLYFTYERYGDLYNKMGKNDSAIYYYKKSLSNAKELNHLNAVKNSYKVLSDFLVSKNINKEEAALYYYNYELIKDSLNSENASIAEKIIQYSLENEKINRKQNIKYNWLILGAITFIASSIVVFYLNKNRKEKEKAEKSVKELEIKYLNNLNNLNNSKFKQLLELSKSNSPEFIILFKELYPGFVSKLKELDPKIRTSELSFCAMLYLNYSTKDISEYTFVTVRAVQIRKNRLRKKYNISSDVDLNKWMRTLYKED